MLSNPAQMDGRAPARLRKAAAGETPAPSRVGLLFLNKLYGYSKTSRCSYGV